MSLLLLNRFIGALFLKFTVIMVVFVVFAVGVVNGAEKVQQYKCSEPVLVTPGHDLTYYIGDSTVPVSVFYEPDNAGATTGGSIALQACTQDGVPNTCIDLDYDSTGNGVPDTNVLDGVGVLTTGLLGITGFPYLRITENVAAPNDEYVICRTF